MSQRDTETHRKPTYTETETGWKQSGTQRQERALRARGSERYQRHRTKEGKGQDGSTGRSGGRERLNRGREVPDTEKHGDTGMGGGGGERSGESRWEQESRERH